MPTPPWSPRRSAISAHLLIQFGIDRGLGLEQCLAGSGLDIRLLGDPSGEIDAAQELSVVRNLVRHLGDACAPGLAAGLRYHLNAYGIWGFALLSSPTFLSAAQLGLRYLDLTFAFHGIRLEVHGDEAHLVLDDAGIPEDLRIFLLERDAAALQRHWHGRTNQPAEQQAQAAAQETGAQALRRRGQWRFSGPGHSRQAPAGAYASDRRRCSPASCWCSCRRRSCTSCRSHAPRRCGATPVAPPG